MTGWFENLAGPVLGPALMWLLIVLVLLAVIWPVRQALRERLTRVLPGISRDRRTRLAVLDIAAVDSRRRLVLVRRDEVEHLLMIGGPSDIVVEQNIRRRPANGARVAAAAAPADSAVRALPSAAATAVPPVAAAVTSAPAPVPPPVPPVEPPVHAADSRLEPPIEPDIGSAIAAPGPQAEHAETAPAPTPAPSVPPVDSPEFDRDLFKAIEATLATIPPGPTPAGEETAAPPETELSRVRPGQL